MGKDSIRLRDIWRGKILFIRGWGRGRRGGGPTSPYSFGRRGARGGWTPSPRYLQRKDSIKGKNIRGERSRWGDIQGGENIIDK